MQSIHDLLNTTPRSLRIQSEASSTICSLNRAIALLPLRVSLPELSNSAASTQQSITIILKSASTAKVVLLISRSGPRIKGICHEKKMIFSNRSGSQLLL